MIIRGAHEECKMLVKMRVLINILSEDVPLYQKLCSAQTQMIHDLRALKKD